MLISYGNDLMLCMQSQMFVMSNHHHGISNQGPISCLFNSLLGVKKGKYQVPVLPAFVQGKPRVIIGSLHKGPIMWKVYPCHIIHRLSILPLFIDWWFWNSVQRTILVRFDFTPPSAGANVERLCFLNWQPEYAVEQTVELPWCSWNITVTWWHHQMETFSALLAICAGNSPVTGEFPAQRPVARNFDVFFDLWLNNRLSTQSWGCWFETPLHPLWRHCNVCTLYIPAAGFHCLHSSWNLQ